jgi:hypothetical protein
MAACQEHGPDVDALVGLTQVALAGGDEESAADFAEAAQEMAPADARVEALLGRLQTLPAAIA